MPDAPPLPAYEADPYRRVLDTEVLEAGVEDGRPWARLADTVLYPEGGGQPADRGRIAGVGVVDVRWHGGAVRHVLEAAIAPGPVTVELDWERRYEHMQHHTGQHLLSALAADRFGWTTTSFHLSGDGADVELDAPAIPAERLLALEDAVAAEVRAARAVRPRRVPPADLAALPVRSRGLPEGHHGDVRLVEIEGLDLNTCGGTHLASTAEIESLHLLRAERARGGTRVAFVAGTRARRRMRAHEARAAELRLLLGGGDDQAAALVRGKLQQVRDAAGREKTLRAELARALAAELAAAPEVVVEAHLEALDAAFLQDLAKALQRAAPAKVALLTAGAPTGSAGGVGAGAREAGAFAVVAGAAAGVDARVVGAAVAERLGGRGGGGTSLYQGKAGDLGRRAEALERLRARVAGGGAAGGAADAIPDPRASES